MTGSALGASRRDVLKTASLLGIGGGALGVSTSTAVGYAPRNTEPWTAVSDWYRVAASPSSNREIRLRSTHTLEYVGVSWEPFGSPVGDGGGCWQHTFRISGTAASVETDRNGENPTLGNTRLQSYASVVAGSDSTAEGDGADNVAVSGRHDADLVGFVNSAVFAEYLRQNEAVLEALATDPENHEVANVHSLVERVHRQRQEDQMESALVSLLLLAIPYVGKIDDAADTAVTLSKAVGTALELWDAGSKMYDAGVPPSTITVDEGFSIERPDVVDVDGHYLTFDVYVAPETTGSFLVETGFLGKDGDTRRWEVAVDAPGVPDDPADLPADRFSARLVGGRNSGTNFVDGPTARIDRTPAGPEFLEPGQTVEFDATASQPGSAHVDAFEWYLYSLNGKRGDISNAKLVDTETGATYRRRLDVSGRFHLRLRVTGADGGSETAFTNFTVGEIPEVTIAGAPDDPVLYEPYQLEADVVDEDSSSFDYEWEVDVGQLESGETLTGKKLKWTFETEAVHDVTLTVTDETGRSGTANATFRPEDKPIADFELRSAPVPDEPLTFTASNARDPNGKLVEYAWEADNGDTASGKREKTFETTFQTSGEREVTLTVTDDEGNADSLTETVDITDRPTASLSATPESVKTDVDSQPDVTFTAEVADTDGTVEEIAWGGDIPTNDRPDADETVTEVATAFQQPGEYTATITVTDDVGATASASATVTVENRSPTVDLSASRYYVEPGTTVSFSADVSDQDGSVETVSWDNAVPDNGDWTRATATFEQPDEVVTVTVGVVDDSGGTAADSVEIHVDTDDAPSVNPGVYPDPAKEGEEVTFVANASDDVTPDSGLTYQWSGAVSGSSDTVTKRFHSGGNKTATVTVTDGTGNSRSESVTVTVEDDQLDSGGSTGGSTTTSTPTDGGGSDGQLQRSLTDFITALLGW